MLEREESATTITQADIDSALSFAGIGERKTPLLGGIPVSEQPDLYLAEMYADRHECKPSRRTRRTARK